ncbi:MAG TPA: methyltransferase domain-containing protein, partial [Micromonosporaceae bacterium]
RLARRARVGNDVSVLDVCCGIAGPGRLITAEFGCRYLGVDYSASTVEIARDLAGDVPCRFVEALVPPLPDGRFEVVLLLETMLAFPDKHTLVADVASVLEPGGRFAFTVEEGRPLTPVEQELMPDADTVWLVELADLTTLLGGVGLTVTWQEDCTAPHREVAAALLRSFESDGPAIERAIGERPLADLIGAHRLWTEWLGNGRVRKFAMVAEKR